MKNCQSKFIEAIAHLLSKNNFEEVWHCHKYRNYFHNNLQCQPKNQRSQHRTLYIYGDKSS
ncbi:hypothetical protein [Okeania sp. SIO1I7]|uniref:hypothetical protein n=1 Tax=Okeania sp. SIO1I7 TaxID=2607772 RepID=UPI0013FA3AEC|nr:hypothetical protein [Okeania sp. SIO1I7]NET27677.1 hypothetical protein [Okeania sp. SIO1I7]